MRFFFKITKHKYGRTDRLSHSTPLVICQINELGRLTYHISDYIQLQELSNYHFSFEYVYILNMYTVMG